MAGLRSQLENMGADLVLTEEEMRATKVTDPSFGCLYVHKSHDVVPDVEVGRASKTQAGPKLCWRGQWP